MLGDAPIQGIGKVRILFDENEPVEFVIERNERRTRTRMAVAGAGAREARTHFEVLELLAAGSYVEVRLETGRTHQIRAHFAAIGHPLAGDQTYGSGAAFGLERQFLHAHRLAFVHPQSGESVEFSSELPADLRAALQLARVG